MSSVSIASNEMVEIEIDNKPISVEPGTTIIEAADLLGIYIPRFCYHKKLSIAANCRMCLVEVEKSPKPVPACATPVTKGMKVFTVSPKALQAQRVVMEFLLINHPLDCPICDQGGECDLQDQSMGYGNPHSHYEQPKRAVFNEDLGPLIDTEMTRCIYCTRCVRFGEEIAGMRELGVSYRGEHSQIGTYVKHMMQSELSGNVIDLCPVGALTAKPSRYTSRAWELLEHPSIAPHDCVGSNIFIHTRGQEYAPQREVMRVVPRENNAINETWISDRDRFSYQGLQHPDRILKPRIKREGQWQEVDWHRTLLEIADRTAAIVQQQGADQIAALVSPNSTIEECYILQKWLRAMGSSHIDHRIRQQDFSDQHLEPASPNLGMKIADLENLRTVLLIGSNVRQEQPLIAQRFYKAYQDGAKILVVNPMNYRYTFATSAEWITADIVAGLAEIVAALKADGKASSQALDFAQQLKSEKIGIFLGEYAINHPQATTIKALARCIAELTGGSVGTLTHGANHAGAWLAGAVPHRGPGTAKIAQPGLDAFSLLTHSPRRAYFLLGIEPEMDCAYPAAALAALKQAGLVVCMSSFVTPAMEQYANFILPITPFSETIGTYVNTEGTWQSFSAVSVPTGDSKPAWKICRVLANLMELPNFDYADIHQLQAELQTQMEKISSPPLPKAEMPNIPVNTMGLIRLATWPIYRVDPIVRRAKALQETMSPATSTIAISPNTAATLQLKAGDRVTAKQGQSQVSLPLRIDNSLADNVVLIPSGLEATAGFGQASVEVTLQREVA